MSETRIILASSSPRRRQLLAEAGYTFDVIPPSESAEGPANQLEPPDALVARLAAQKCEDVALRVTSGVVIGCDTVAACEGAILGKPRDEADARQMLTSLRGRVHFVWSGLCLWRRPDDAKREAVAVTKLVMDAISDRQLEDYLATGQWQGKAGAFGYQDGLDWVRVVEGSESNVVGLPMERLTDLLAELS
jgi:septum formation protein